MEGIPVMLVGNKCDEESGKREVSKKTGEALQVKLPKRVECFSNHPIIFKSSPSQSFGHLLRLELPGKLL